MRKTVLLLFMTALLALSCSAFAGEGQGAAWTGREWDGDIEAGNNEILFIGRESARVDSVPYADLESALTGAAEYRKELSPYYLLLSQKEWKFSWYENPSLVSAGPDAAFWQPDFDDSAWKTIFVPSVWQTQGYDVPIYTNTTQKFARQFGNDDIGYPRDLPKAPEVYNPVGLYRRTFEVPGEWAGKRVYIDFEGTGAAMYLWVNGIQAGYAEDSFTTHEFDITDYVLPDRENILAVQVYRWCDGSWIEDQDMYDLSGIFRDVYVYAAPQVRVRDYSIVTDFDDTFTDSVLQVTAAVRNYTGTEETAKIRLRLFDGAGNEIGLENSCLSASVPAGTETELSFSVPVTAPRKWSAEDPYLYTLALEETAAGGTVYEAYLVGFRKITYKTTASGWYEDGPTDHDLIRINGQPVSFRGVDRHETHPALGYALTKEIMEEDIRILLENNINSVRTSHYPDNPYWYYLCDRYGIYVVDEANIECHSNMVSENERISLYLSSAIIDREYSMVRRDRNHASVIMWSLGNENKNPEILRTVLVESLPDPEGTSHILHEYTKDRPWHYEQARDMYETGIDVRSGMYALPDELTEHGETDGPVPMIECEYEHAMGNSEGNFDEYWTAFETYRNLQGGFIWDFIDQSIYAVNEDGELYFGYGGDYGEHNRDGNFCANGLLLPDRTVQPEMAEVRYHYQQIKFNGTDPEKGLIEIRNWFLFTDPAEKYDFRWELKRNDTVLQEGVLDENLLHISCVDSVSNAAGTTVVSIPFEWSEKDLMAGCDYFLNLYVTLKADDGLLKAGHVMAMEQFELHPDLPDAPEQTFSALTCTRAEGKTVIEGEDFAAAFDEVSGQLVQYEAFGRNLIVPGEGPAGSFYRAATDNDSGFGYGLTVFNRSWKTPGEYVVDTYLTEVKEDRAEVSVLGTYPGLNGLRLDTVYTVYGDGVIRADVRIIPQYTENLAYIPVAGMQLTVPGEYEQVTYFGRGPEENYADRRMGTKAGVYRTTVTDNFFPYVKSSETGNRTGMRWLALTDENGFGLLAASCGDPMETSALHYTAEELDRRVHPYELNALADTILRLNAVQIGVGGDNSWSRIVPHEPYLPHDPEYCYSFALTPLRAEQDRMEAYLSVKNR